MRCARGAWDDRGSGTVLMLGIVAATLVIVAGIALLAHAQSARGAAQAAADLGALAAAEQLAAGSRSGLGAAGSGAETPVGPALAARACGLAREVVRANGAVLAQCDLLGQGVVRVRAAVTAGARTATASARAGPAHPLGGA